MRFIIFVLFFSFVLLSCGNSSSSENQGNESQEQEAVLEESQAYLPSLPDSIAIKLWKDCESIDYLFHELPISVSQTDKVSIRSNVQFLLPQSPEIRPDCNSIGRVFFVDNTGESYEAEIYIGGPCNYYVFFSDNEPVYANKINQEGINFFTDLIKRFTQ